MDISCIYDSDSFCVLHLGPAPVVFEIVDRSAETSLCLHGVVALNFEKQIAAWKDVMPSQDAVEAKLAELTFFAQQKVIQH